MIPMQINLVSNGSFITLQFFFRITVIASILRNAEMFYICGFIILDYCEIRGILLIGTLDIIWIWFFISILDPVHI